MIQVQIPDNAPRNVVTVARSLKEARTVLLINAAEALPLLSPHADREGNRQTVVLTQMRMLGEAMLQNVNPDAVVAPLIASDWDIVDLGILLEELGYRGALYALTRPLPRAELVIRELGAVCPRLTVQLLEIA